MFAYFTYYFIRRPSKRSSVWEILYSITASLHHSITPAMNQWSYEAIKEAMNQWVPESMKPSMKQWSNESMRPFWHQHGFKATPLAPTFALKPPLLYQNGLWSHTATSQRHQLSQVGSLRLGAKASRYLSFSAREAKALDYVGHPPVHNDSPRTPWRL